MPNPMVSATETTTIAIGNAPSAVICPSVMRTPRSATPKRSSVLAENWMPGTQRPSVDRKFRAMPSSNANSIDDAP